MIINKIAGNHAPSSDAETLSTETLSEEAKPSILALSVMMNRIAKLSKEDRKDFVELLNIWNASADTEERQSAFSAMEEILAQRPVHAQPLPAASEHAQQRLKIWKEFVGAKIRAIRKNAGFTQEQLAEKAGLPQSHISRIENAEYSPTHMTIEKIATALGFAVQAIDPSFDQ